VRVHEGLERAPDEQRRQIQRRRLLRRVDDRHPGSSWHRNQRGVDALVFSMRIKLPIIAAVVAVAGAALPAVAQAGPRQAMAFEAPTELMDPQQRTATLQEIASFGVDNVRQLVYWQSFAPRPNAKRKPRFNAADPNAYPAGTWDRLDGLVRDAGALGIKVQLTLTGPVPRWATGSKKGHTNRPSVKEFGRWVKAVGRRYGGQVSMWSLWNEPNSSHFLSPQRSRGKAVAPMLYRKLYLAGVKALRATRSNRRDTILLGETAPRANRRTTGPLAFLRGTLCLDKRYHRARRCKRLPADGYAHHAYTTRTGPHFHPRAGDVTIGVLGRLTKALDRAARAKAVPKRLKLYLTEFGIQTYPDRIAGVPQSRQPAYLAISEHIAYTNPRVAEFSQYLMRDDRRRGGFQTGLRTADGRKKPAYAAFRIPLAVERYGRRDVLWGLVRPYRQTTRVVIQSRVGGKRWKTIKRKRTSSRGVYGLLVRHRKGVSYRVRWTSPEGKRYTGPPIRAY
jgi:hypothetical protein